MNIEYSMTAYLFQIWEILVYIYVIQWAIIKERKEYSWNGIKILSYFSFTL